MSEKEDYKYAYDDDGNELRICINIGHYFKKYKNNENLTIDQINQMLDRMGVRCVQSHKKIDKLNYIEIGLKKRDILNEMGKMLDIKNYINIDRLELINNIISEMNKRDGKYQSLSIDNDKQLYEIANKLDIKNYTLMGRPELIDEIVTRMKKQKDNKYEYMYINHIRRKRVIKYDA